MKKFLGIILGISLFITVYGQGGCIPETISYHYGANWGANQTFVNPLPTNYYMQHGDMNSFTPNDVISSSTISEFTPAPGPPPVILREKYIKVHRLNLTNITTQDIKYAYEDINSFAHVPAQVLSTYRSGTGLQLLTGSYGEDFGLIKEFEFDNSVHHDIHVGFTTPFTAPVGTVITKVIESGGFLYAIGYKHVHTGVEIYPFIARIPVGYLATSTPCQMVAGCNDVIIRSLPNRGLGGPPQGFFVDIREMNGEIYFCGSLDDHMVVGRWNANDAVQFIMPITGAFATPQSMFNQMTAFSNELYLTYYSRRGPGVGVLVLNPNLAIQRQMSFDASAYTLLPATPRAGAGTIRVIPSTIDVIDNQNLLLGGYIVDGRIHSFVVNVRHNTPALVNFGFLQKEGHFDVEPQPGLQKSNINDPNPNYRVFTRTITDDIYLANTSRLINGINPNFQGVYITRKSLAEFQNQAQVMNGPCDDLPEISLNVVNHQIVANVPENMIRLDHDVESYANPETEIGCRVQVREDYKHWCPEPIQDELDETICPYVQGVIASQTINSVTNDLAPTDEVRLCQGGCINLRADINLRLGNTLTNTNLRRYIWLRDGTDMNLPRNQCNIDVCDPDAGTYTLQVLHEESTGICTAQFNVVVLPPNVPTIVATPSEYICQNQSAVLSISNPQPTSYVWTRPLVSTSPINTAANITVNNPPDQYACEVIYANGCSANSSLDIFRRDLEISQTISETGGNTELLSIMVCNHNSADANNVLVRTNLALPNIMENGAAAAGWVPVSGYFEFNIPKILGAATPTVPVCTTITMPVRVNKCPTTNLVQASITDPAFTCPTIISSQAYWPNNGYTPTLAATFNNIPVTKVCNGNPITMTATPGNGTNYIWRENGVIRPYFGNANIQVINYQSLAYFSNIEVDITRNQCTQRANMTIGFGNTPTNTFAITHKTCNPVNVLGAVNLTVTPAAPYTFLWNNGATTEDLTSLDPLAPGEDYSVTVTDLVGCQSTQLATVLNQSPINIAIQRRLIGCADQVEYTVTPTGGTPPYTYEWRFAASNLLTGGTGSVHTNFGNLILRVTDNAGCTNRMLVTPNIVNLTAFTSNSNPIPNPVLANYTNSIIILPNNINVELPWSFTNCDIKFMGMGNRITIASPSANNQAGIILNNSRISTCGDFLARGIIMTKSGDYIHAQGSTLEDMFAAIAIEPATGQGAGSFYLPMSGNTFRNNFIGIRINAPTINLVQNRLSATGATISSYFSNNNFIGAAAIKPFTAGFYPNANLIAGLEQGFNGANWGSYAGCVLNTNAPFHFTDNLTGAGTPNFFTGLANGILSSNGSRNVFNANFNNINPAGVTTGNSSFAQIGNAIYALGTSANTLDVRGFSSWTNDIANVRNAIYVSNLNLNVSNMKLASVADKGIEVNRSTTNALTMTISQNQITAAKPITISNRTNDIMTIANNTIYDLGTTANAGAMVDILGSGATLASSANNKIENNTLFINNSSFGMRIANLNGTSNIARYDVYNNTMILSNANSSNPSYAALQLSNSSHINVVDNKIKGVGNYAVSNNISLTNSAPIGIWTNALTNSALSCNNMETIASGSYHEKASHGLEIMMNNYLSKNYGMLFYDYTNTTITPHIPPLSNKFYCYHGLSASNYLQNINSSGTGSNVSIGFNTSWAIPFPSSPCPANPAVGSSWTCPSGTAMLFTYYYNDPSTITGFTNTIFASNFPPVYTCRLYCPSASPSAPPQKMAGQKKDLEVRCTLYPNPSSGAFSLLFEQLDPSIISLDIEIKDIEGRIVYTKKNQVLESHQIDIQTQLHTGNYFVQINHVSGLYWVKKLTITQE
jgi:hypothetical protein